MAGLSDPAAEMFYQEFIRILLKSNFYISTNFCCYLNILLLLSI